MINESADCASGPLLLDLQGCGYTHCKVHFYIYVYIHCITLEGLTKKVMSVPCIYPQQVRPFF